MQVQVAEELITQGRNDQCGIITPFDRSGNFEMLKKYSSRLTLKYLVALLACSAAFGCSAAQLMFSNSSPAFISTNNTVPRVWVATISQSTSGSSQLQIRYSDDEGNNWTLYGTLDCAELQIDVSAGPPSSIFVHSSGTIFLAERVHTPPDASQAKIWKVSGAPGSNLSAERVVTLDPTATIRPWGWTEDKDGNLYAAQYGFAGLTHFQTNVSYILKIADSAGNAVAEFSNWQWPITAYPESDIAQWIAPRGVVSDRHVHNLRYSQINEKFYINGGDSPRNISAWSGSLNQTPSLFPRINSGANTCSSANYLLTGFTGMAFASDGIYTGDDFTSCPGDSTTLNARGNSIRFYPWASMTNGVPNAGVDPTLNIKRLANPYDTPIFDLHSSNDGLNLFFINYDETHCDHSTCQPGDLTPPVRMSAVHRLSRTSIMPPTASGSASAPSAPWSYKVVDCFQSSYVNLSYIASDRYSGIPTGMTHVFASSETCAVDLVGKQMDSNCVPNQVWRIDTGNATPSYCPAN